MPTSDLLSTEGMAQDLGGFRKEVGYRLSEWMKEDPQWLLLIYIIVISHFRYK